MSYSVLQCHTHFSLRDCLSQPKQIAHRAKELGINAVAMCDHANISGCVDFVKAMNDVKVKWILGNEFNIDTGGTIIVLAKNKAGWLDLVKATSYSNLPENYQGHPCISLTALLKFNTGNWVVISGYTFSVLTFQLFTGQQAVSVDEIRKYVVPNYKDIIHGHIPFLKQVFKDDFYLGVQFNDNQGCPIQLASNAMAKLAGKKYGVKLVALTNSHYIKTEDALDHRVLLCTDLKIKLDLIKSTLQNDNSDRFIFTRSDKYYIPSLEDLRKWAIESTYDGYNETIENTNEVASKCENYSILGQPMLPDFDCPDGMDAGAYLSKLCDEGMQRLGLNDDKYKKQLKYELKILNEAKLPGYFLIVRDYVKHAIDNGCFVNLRGSGVGSIVCYLIGISLNDPIKYDLLFERFYNSGRNTVDNIQYPDLDVDFPLAFKDKVFTYIESKYGTDKVSQMITFNRMQGRGALKDVLKVRGAATFSDINKITKHIPSEAAISDQLQDMKEETGESSIIRWALENEGSKLKDYCAINKDGKLEGEYATFFEQAIRMEGTKVIKGKHAAGVIISKNKLIDVCPMVYDEKSEKLIAGVEMKGMEAMGYVKFDILSVGTLDRIMLTRDAIKEKLCFQN